MASLNELFLNARAPSFGVSGTYPGKSVAEVRAEHSAETDAELVAAFIKGDGDSFAALVDRHMSMVYKFTYRYVGDADNANDVVQDVFIKGVEKYQEVRRAKEFQDVAPYHRKKYGAGFYKKEKAGIVLEDRERGDRPRHISCAVRRRGRFAGRYI